MPGPRDLHAYLALQEGLTARGRLVWPSGKEHGWQLRRFGFGSKFGSPFSGKVWFMDTVLSLWPYAPPPTPAINETLKMVYAVADLNADPLWS